MSAKKSRPLLRAFIFLMIALVLFSTVAIIAVYTSSTPAQNGIQVTTWSVATWTVIEPTIIIPGSATGAITSWTTASWADEADTVVGADIQLSLTGA